MAEAALINRRAPEAFPLSMRQVAAVLFRQRRLALVCFVAIFLLFVAYGMLAPSYTAHMKILVRRGRADPVVSPQPTAPIELGRDQITEEELNSEVEFLRDEELLGKVVQATGLSERDPLRFLRLGREEAEVRIARAVRRLAQRLKVEPLRKTNLILVRYDSGDPELAARVLGTLARLYVDKHTQVHRPSGESNFFEQQTTEYGNRLKDAELQLMNLTREQGVVSAALERDIALQKLSEADANYHQVALAVAETEQRIRALEQRMPSLPERTTTQVRTADNPQLLEKLKSALLDLELKRTDLLTRYEPSYRLVQEVEQQIAEARAAIAAEAATPVREETTEKDPNHEWAKTELEKARVELSGLRARVAGAAGQLVESRRQARHLAEQAITQEDLLRTMKAAEENYLLYVRKREEARIGDAMDERGILNVMIAEQPAVPALPAITLPMWSLLGLIAGSVVSTGLTFAKDFLDPAFRTPDEVIEYLDAPVLASLPRGAA